MVEPVEFAFAAAKFAAGPAMQAFRSVRNKCIIESAYTEAAVRVTTRYEQTYGSHAGSDSWNAIVNLLKSEECGEALSLGNTIDDAILPRLHHIYGRDNPPFLDILRHVTDEIVNIARATLSGDQNTLGGIIMSLRAIERLEADQRHKELLKRLDSLGLDEDALLKIAQHLNQQQSLRQKFTHMESKWVPLPSISFKSQIPESDDLLDDFAKFFNKIAFRVIALSIENLVPSHLQEIQFVGLYKMTWTEDELGFEFWTPVQELIGLIRDRFQSPSAMDVVRSENYDLEILHQYSLVPNVLNPIAFVYTPSLKRLQIVNRNHFSNPSYFLSPHRCHTTSGFLNFIGTFLLQAELKFHGSTAIIYFDNFEEVLDADLDDFLKWLNHFVNTGIAFDPHRIFISTENPEKYFYQYTAE